MILLQILCLVTLFELRSTLDLFQTLCFHLDFHGVDKPSFYNDITLVRHLSLDLLILSLFSQTNF